MRSRSKPFGVLRPAVETDTGWRGRAGNRATDRPISRNTARLVGHRRDYDATRTVRRGHARVATTRESSGNGYGRPDSATVPLQLNHTRNLHLPAVLPSLYRVSLATPKPSRLHSLSLSLSSLFLSPSISATYSSRHLLLPVSRPYIVASLPLGASSLSFVSPSIVKPRRSLLFLLHLLRTSDTLALYGLGVRAYMSACSRACVRVYIFLPTLSPEFNPPSALRNDART